MITYGSNIFLRGFMLQSHNFLGRATKVGIALVLAGVSLTAAAQPNHERVALREKARSILVNNGCA